MHRPGAHASFSGQRPSQKEIQALVQLQQEGNFTRLENRARKLLKRFPNLPVLLMLYAEAQSQKGKKKQAIQILQRLVSENPSLADAQHNLGQLLTETDRMEEAAIAMQASVDLNPDAVGFNSLGAILREIDRIDDAVQAFQKACSLRPDFHQAHYNLGLATAAKGDYENARDAFQEAVQLSPTHVSSHFQLAVCERELNNTANAETGFQKTLELDPNFTEAALALGMLLRASGKLNDAYALFEKVDGDMGQVRRLETLLLMGEGQRFKLALDEVSENSPQNRWIAAVAAFGCHQFAIDNQYPFAPDPISYVSVRHLQKEIVDIEGFMAELIAAADQRTAVWENRTTRGGFQTYGNLFAGTDAPQPFRMLESHIRKQITEYLHQHSNSADLFIKNFPKKFGLFGWRVKLMSAGHQIAHIHAKGWMSGVFYLKIPSIIKEPEGSIVFSLHGFDYPITNPSFPEIRHLPTPGELVLFPSSLFHSTVPFESDEERQCIAFDVVPLD